MDSESELAWIEALACGDLSGEAYREALRRLDAQPHLWRRCGLALLEEQALTLEMRSLVSDPDGWSPREQDVLRPGPASPRPLGPIDASEAGSEQSEQHAAQRRAQWWPNDWRRLAALAGLLLLGFCSGWLAAGSGIGGRPDSGRILTRQQAHAPASHSAVASHQDRWRNDPPDEASARDEIHPESNSLRPSVADDAPSAVSPPGEDANPNMDLRLVSGRFMPLDREMPPALQQLEEEGAVRIEAYDALMPIDFNDGSSALLPVQQFRVVPVVFSY